MTKEVMWSQLEIGSLAGIYEADGRVDKARAELLKYRAIVERLIRQYPSFPHYLDALSEAGLGFAMKEPAVVVAEARKARDLLQRPSRWPNWPAWAN